MNETERRNLMRNLNNDLLNDEVESPAGDIDFDIESVIAKTNKKIRRVLKMNKNKKIIPLAAACLAAAIGLSTVYARDISKFFRSFSNKTVVGGIAVYGDSFRLGEPVALGGANTLNEVVFTGDTLRLVFAEPLEPETVEGMSITDDAGVNYIFGGGRPDMVFFASEGYVYPLRPVSGFVLTFMSAEYDVRLIAAPPALDFEIIPAVSSAAAVDDLVSVGLVKTPSGIQIMASFNDDKFSLGRIGAPSRLKTESHVYINEDGTGSGGFASEPEPLVGYGENASYEFRWAEPDQNTIPPTVFVSDAPDGEKLTLNIPGIVALYKNYADADTATRAASFALPELNGRYELDLVFDFGVQRAAARHIRRVSESVVELSFDLNTGDNKAITIYDLGLNAFTEKSWETHVTGDTATIIVELKDTESETVELFYSSAVFIIYGDWDFIIE